MGGSDTPNPPALWLVVMMSDCGTVGRFVRDGGTFQPVELRSRPHCRVSRPTLGPSHGAPEFADRQRRLAVCLMLLHHPLEEFEKFLWMRVAIARRKVGESLVSIARLFSVHHSMISRLAD